MWNRDAHVTDQELLQAADGELSATQNARVTAHLKACWSCRARKLTIENTIAGFIDARDHASTPELPSIDGPRALLRARLREAAPAQPRRLWNRNQHWVYTSAAAGVLLVAGIAGVVMQFAVRDVGAAWTPDSRLTPGVSRTVDSQDVCSVQSVDGFYPIPATLAYRVFEKYGIRNPPPRSYEVDYLITPALGGADDIRNLWPQPYASGTWNAHLKDALEDHLYELVCQGQLDLHIAQKDISRDWIAAYKKYFQTEHPIARHASFTKDPAWE